MARPGAALTAFAICTFIWGTTWLAIKEGYGGLDPMWAASLRFFLASAILLAFILVRRPPWPRDRQAVLVILFVGLVLFGADYGLIYWGEQFIDSGLTAILFAMMPLFVGIFGSVIIPHERWTVAHGVGVLAGLVGLVAIFRSELSAAPGTFWPMAAVVASAAAAAVASLVMRRWGAGIHVFVLNGTAMFVGAAALLVAAVVRGERIGLPADASAWWSVLYLAVFGSVVSFLLYIWLLRRWTAHKVSLLTLLTPVVAVVAGFLVLGERLSLLQWLGAALVLGGVAVALFVPAPAAKAAPAGESS